MHDPSSTAALPSSSRLLVGRRPPLPLLRRSSSLRSRRSVTSTGSSSSATVATTASGSKRVSFHRDVRVKRIPSYLGERGRFGSGSFKRRHHRTAPSPPPPPDPSAGLVRRLDPPHSRQALAKEARKVLREADRVTCTTLPLPKGAAGGGGGKAAAATAAVPLLLLGRRKQQRRAQPPPRLHISTPLPPPAGAPLPAVVTFSSAEEGGGASTTDYSSLERPPRERRKKKALSPIIEATTPVIVGPASAAAGDYFSARSTGGGESRSISAAAEDGGASGDSLLRSSGRDESSLDSLTREDFREDDDEETSTHCVETSTGGRMVHSSQMPADRPPLTRGTVTGLAQQLSTTTRRPKGPPPVVGRGYATTLMDAYGADDYIVNHNNNRPFSYTDPSSVQATLPKSAAHPRNGVDSDGIGVLDQRVPRGGKEVIYAQVVVSGREGGGGGEGGGSSSRTGGGGVKRTVHTSVLNHQRVEKVPVVVAAEGAGRIYSRPKGRKRLGSEGEEEDEEEEDYEEETKTKGAGEEEEEDEGIAGDMMRIGGGGVGAGGVTSSSYYSHHHRSTSSRAADSGKVDYIDGDYRSRRNAKPFQKSSDPRRIENYKRFDEDDEDDLADRTYRRGSLDYGLNKADQFGKGLAYNRKDLFDSGIENDSGVGGSGRRRPKAGGKVTVGEGVTAKIVMNGGPNLRSPQIGGSCNNISRVTITNDSPGLGGSKDRFFYYGASPEDSTTLQDKRRGSGSTTTTVNNNNSKSGNVTSSSMVSTRLVRAADKRRDADLPTSSVLIRHWAPSADEKHSGHDQQLIVEEAKVESYYHRERRRRRRRTSEGYEEEEEEEIDERNGHPQDGDDSHHRRPRSGKDKGKGRLEDLEEEEQRVNGKDGSHSDIDDYDERNNNTTTSRRYQKKGEATLKKKTTSAVIEEEDQYVVDKKGKAKKGEKEGEEKKKRGFRQFFSRKSGSGAKETTEEKGGATGDYHKSTYDRRKDRTDGYASAEERRSHANSTTNHDPSGRHKDRWFSEDEIDRREDRTPPSRRKYTADGHSSSATLSRLVASNNRKNKASAASTTTAGDANTGGRWFKSLDRLTRRKKKEEEEVEEDQRTIPQKETTPPPKADAAVPGGNKKNLRFFGDTDQESVASGHQRTARNGTRRPVGIMASGRRSGASEEEESGTTTESSAPSQRSVYLHAATVGDIPGPAKAPVPAAPPAGLSKTTKKKAGSREELQQRRTPVVTNKTTLSRSVSVLAPWRPRHRPGSNVDVHYDSSGAYTPNPNGGGGMVTGRPPKAPRTANGNGAGVRSSRGMSASVESLQRGGTSSKKASPPRQTGGVQRSSRDGRDSALRTERRHGSSRRDINKVGVERVSAHDGAARGSSGVTVTRSASMPKDSRLAGWWFRRKKVGQATGKENYGGSANRG